MKIAPILSGLFALVALSATAQSQNQSGLDSTGLPGDHFSLQGALAMFQKASSPENFEKLINDENNHVNNLDLNEDGSIDYIRVIDNADKDKSVHAFVLQAVVSESESQDIAVIELERTGDSTAVIQIVGDEDIYGEEVIVEPEGGDDEAYIPSYAPEIAHGPAASLQSIERGIVINIWAWPSVRYVYTPLYRPWVSPWRWRHYPVFWRPWRAMAWSVWHPRTVVYRRPFVVVRTHRIARARFIYRPLRVTSVTVRSRHATAVNGYRVTRTKTTVTGPRGHKSTRTTTTVRGRGGKVKAKKTTVRRR